MTEKTSREFSDQDRADSLRSSVIGLRTFALIKRDQCCERNDLSGALDWGKFIVLADQALDNAR